LAPLSFIIFKTLVTDITAPPDQLKQKNSRRQQQRRVQNLAILVLSQSTNYAMGVITGNAQYFRMLGKHPEPAMHQYCAPILWIAPS
jgi:hypothetical protein